MKVKVETIDSEKTFDDVTKIKGTFAFDMFENFVEIYQGKKKTKIKQSDIDFFEIIE